MFGIDKRLRRLEQAAKARAGGIHLVGIYSAERLEEMHARAWSTLGEALTEMTGQETDTGELQDLVKRICHGND